MIKPHRLQNKIRLLEGLYGIRVKNMKGRGGENVSSSITGWKSSL